MNNSCFQTGDLVRCIDGTDSFGKPKYQITEGKIYKVIRDIAGFIEIKGNDGFIDSFYKYRFEKVKKKKRIG